ncbi:TIGR02221 family CRISPR-associated protein [Caloranaerobacter sp. DY30410]|uniref:TIGR02221 family CRISPR-associated protein n=1 Tax=Caloranaerobacter sp. DY30410 TaxID=3238305 RepID=UPI003D049B57
MARKFLSFLGKNDYKECCYVFQRDDIKEEVKTKFIQEALVKILCKDWNEEDKVIVFLTKEAEKSNWNNEENPNRRLKERFEKYFEKYDIKIKDIIKPVNVPEGKNEKEIWEIFDKVLNEIDESDEIIFDITHSFRSLPMLALVILNYAKVLKNIKLKGIYYGAYEARVLEEGEEKAPIFNLTAFDELLEWTQAVNTFLKYGNSGHLREISKTVLKEQLSKRDKLAISINSFIKRLENFTNCIYTCRGKYIDNVKGADERSVQYAYNLMKQKLDEVVREENHVLKPIVPLFKKIERETQNFENANNFSTGMAVVKWSIKNNLTQQAYTALEETLKTYICMKFGLDETNAKERENIAKTALIIKGAKKEKNSWKIEDTDKFSKEEVKKKVEYIVNNIEDELGKIADRLSKLRNDINHFGYSGDTATKCSDLHREIKNIYKEFEEYVKKHPIDDKT